MESGEFLKKMKEKGIQAGVALSRFFPKETQSILLNITEVNSKEEIENLVQALQEVR